MSSDINVLVQVENEVPSIELAIENTTTNIDIAVTELEPVIVNVLNGLDSLESMGALEFLQHVSVALNAPLWDKLAWPSNGAGGGGGSVFITNVVPTGSGNVGGSVYDTTGVHLLSCTSDTNFVTVSVIAFTGTANYLPNVIVNDIAVTLGTTVDKGVFTGTVSIDLTGVTEIRAMHEDGASSVVEITTDAKPVITSAYFTGTYPSSQTELKAGDTFGFTINTDIPVIAIAVSNSGASIYSTHAVSANTVQNIDIIIANRGNVTATYGVSVRVQKSTGSWSDWYNTDTIGSTDAVHVVTLNNLYPTCTVSTIQYPASQGALKDNEQAYVTNSVSNYSSLTYTSPTGELSILNSSTYESTKTVSRQSGSYNTSTANFTVTAYREANGTSASASTVVYIANDACTLTILTPTRLRSGGNLGTAAQNHTVTITSNQKLYAAPSMTAPAGTWQGSAFTGSTTIWTRALQVHDNDTKGIYTFTNISATNLSGKVTTTALSGTSYTLGGFVFRTLTVASYPIREAVIGTVVTNTSKLRCTNLSKGVTGSLNYSFINSLAETVNSFTITSPTGVLNNGGNIWYNNDGLNASSNTSGSLKIELEEVI